MESMPPPQWDPAGPEPLVRRRPFWTPPRGGLNLLKAELLCC